MRRLTDEERIALREVGPPGEGPVSDATFDECVRMGWGYWEPPPIEERPAQGYWKVTVAGREALRLDDLARTAS
ncbi:MAG: hypothetical protein ACYDDZ_14045 [Acidimicrobiales bacterium]